MVVCGNEEIYEQVGRELVHNTLEGYNSCLFAYGQTGTGKTLTMTGNRDQEGMVQMCFRELLERLSRSREVESYSVKMSFLEIYNETINDLISGRRGEIAVRESPNLTFTSKDWSAWRSHAGKTSTAPSERVCCAGLLRLLWPTRAPPGPTQF